MQPSLLQGATRRFAVLVFSSGINPLKSTTRTICTGRVSPARTGTWALAGRPVCMLWQVVDTLPLSSVSHLSQPVGRKFVTAL